MSWLDVRRGDMPMIVAFPHTGSDIPEELERQFASGWLARKDADWWVNQLYDFAAGLGATTIRTSMSRSVIDVNRDPSGASLYPGQATTGLCPTTTFDGEALYLGSAPTADEIIWRREQFFDPYHAAIAAEIDRLRQRHGRVVVYDAHSIRSSVPRLFDGVLPHFNIGTNGGVSCDPTLTTAVMAVCAASGFDHVLDGRFRGGWTTRHHGRPSEGVHAIQMELAIRGYMDEPDIPDPVNWPSPFDRSRAAEIVPTLTDIVKACIAFTQP